MGVWLGTKDGLQVYLRVGTGVGATVGIAVGAAVGFSDGLALGMNVGSVVGVTDGVFEGAADVGATVGSFDCRSAMAALRPCICCTRSLPRTELEPATYLRLLRHAAATRDNSVARATISGLYEGSYVGKALGVSVEGA